MRDRVRTAVEAENQVLHLGPTADAAIEELAQAYRDAHDRVLVELDSDRSNRLLVTLDRLVDSPPSTEKAAAPAGKALPRLVAHSYQGVRRLVKVADATPPGEAREELLHDARKAAKRARYAGESVARGFGKDAEAFAEAMEAVQDGNGEAAAEGFTELADTREAAAEDARQLVASDVLAEARESGLVDDEPARRLRLPARQELFAELRRQEQQHAREQLVWATRRGEDAVEGVIEGVAVVVRHIVPTALLRPEDVIETTYALADQGLRLTRRLALTVVGSVRSLTV